MSTPFPRHDRAVHPEDVLVATSGVVVFRHVGWVEWDRVDEVGVDGRAMSGALPAAGDWDLRRKEKYGDIITSYIPKPIKAQKYFPNWCKWACRVRENAQLHTCWLYGKRRVEALNVPKPEPKTRAQSLTDTYNKGCFPASGPPAGLTCAQPKRHAHIPRSAN